MSTVSFRSIIALGFAATVLVHSGCASEEKLVAPTSLRSPWEGERVWAVAPLTNESGVSTVDTFRLSDQFVIELDGVEGISCLSLNRTLAGMQALGMRQVTNDADARSLMRVLQTDGLLVAAVTAYDPYRPLQLGIAAQVYTADDAAAAATDVSELTMARGGDEGSTRTAARSGPSSQTSRVYAANNHAVLAKVGEYAAGRHNPRSGLRKNVYLASMDSYARFVAYDVVRELLAAEFAQRAPLPTEEEAGAAKKKSQ
ncbi:MAG: hypothetical protein SGJ11_11575 [Phycisphaerae bacterium]|nr:hypothetical protein [Phycisphaerae bacterium]